jgi:hypothetical protein
MADLRDILNVKLLKSPTRSLNTLLNESAEQAQASIVEHGRLDDDAPAPPLPPAVRV